MEQFLIEDVLHMPKLASEHGRSVDTLLIYVHALMAALFVGWLLYFLYTLVRFRQSRNPKADHIGVKTHLSNYLEGGVAFIEAVLLIGFAVPLWAAVVSNPPTDKNPVEIHIVGRQFNWNAHYAGQDAKMGRQLPELSTSSDAFGVDRKGDPTAADDIVVQGNIVVPVGRPVIARLTSLDVIHSFAVRSLRVCQDAVPGMSVPTWFTPTRIGEYKITCAQLCGNSHYGMAGVLKVVSAADFDKWVAEQSAKAKGASAAPVSYE